MLWGAPWWLKVSMTTPTLVYPCWILRQVARLPVSSTKPLCPDSGCVQMSWVPSVVLPGGSQVWGCHRAGEISGSSPQQSIGQPVPRGEMQNPSSTGAISFSGKEWKKYTLAPLSGGLVLELASDVIQGKSVKTLTQEKYAFGVLCCSRLQELKVAAWRIKDTSGTIFIRFIPDRSKEEFSTLEALSGESLSGAFTRLCAKRGFPTCDLRRSPFCVHKKSKLQQQHLLTLRADCWTESGWTSQEFTPVSRCLGGVVVLGEHSTLLDSWHPDTFGRTSIFFFPHLHAFCMSANTITATLLWSLHVCKLRHFLAGYSGRSGHPYLSSNNLSDPWVQGPKHSPWVQSNMEKPGKKAHWILFSPQAQWILHQFLPYNTK